MSSTLSLFQPERDLPPEFMVIMYGMRRTGKTTMLLHMLEAMKERFKYTQVHVFSGTADENPAQWRNFPPGFVTADIANIDVHLGDILREQQEMIREEVQNQVHNKHIRLDAPPGKKENSERASKKAKITAVTDEAAIQNDTTAFEHDMFTSIVAGDQMMRLTDSQINELRRAGKIDETRFPRRLIVLDDVVNENRIRFSSNLNKLAVSGRHIFISCIILSQSVTGSASVPPIIRRNSDYIIVVGYPRSVHERKMLAEEYLTIGNEGDAIPKALRILKDVTQMAYRAFVISVINNTATEYNQFLFQYGPVPPPPRNVSKSFKLGTEKQWKYRLHHGDREAEFKKENQAKKPTKKADGRFSNSRQIRPVYRSNAANENDPFAVQEFFYPNLF